MANDGYIPTDADYQQMQEEEAAYAAETTAAWQFEEERKYCEQLVISYPQDSEAQNARVWLERYA